MARAEMWHMACVETCGTWLVSRRVAHGSCRNVWHVACVETCGTWLMSRRVNHGSCRDEWHMARVETCDTWLVSKLVAHGSCRDVWHMTRVETCGTWLVSKSVTGYIRNKRKLRRKTSTYYSDEGRYSEPQMKQIFSPASYIYNTCHHSNNNSLTSYSLEFTVCFY